jgi:aminopeptidase N
VVHAFYRPDRRRGGWGEMAKDGGDIVRVLSQALWPYPYPHMTVVDGPASCGGMEYPMLTCIGGQWSPKELFLTTAHEIAHMWFPMQVGSDEKRFAWQDEGMAQFFQAYPMRLRHPEVDDLAESRRTYLDVARGGETELMRHGDRYPGSFNYGVASYYKPAAVLDALRGMVGDSTFLRAFREYGRRWNGRHPMPRDFFNTVNDVTGRDLDWFWRAWYYETWKLDQALGEVTRRGDEAVVEVENRGKVPMPVLVVARGARGDTTTATVPAEAWLAGEKSVTITMKVPADLVRIEIDPERRLPDINPLNQTWPRRDD